MKQIYKVLLPLVLLTSCSINNQNSIPQIEKRLANFKSSVKDEKKLTQHEKTRTCKYSGELKALSLELLKNIAIEDLTTINDHPSTQKTKELSAELKEIVSYLSTEEAYYKRPICNAK